MNVVALIIQLISGAVGGNVAGAFLKRFSLGTVGNSIVGILGGGLGGQILGLLGVGGPGMGAAPMDTASIVTSIVGGLLGGGLLMTIIGLIRKMMAKSPKVT